jgi:predicted nucleic acid-binding protein
MASLNDLLGHRVYLDTNVFIYTLNGFPNYAEFLRGFLDAMDGRGLQAVTSEFTLAELLVIPFRHGDAGEEARCRQILQPRPGLELVPVTREVLEGMARLRASHQFLRAPDALHLATAQLAGCEFYLTNDDHLQSAASIRVVILSQISLA